MDIKSLINTHPRLVEEWDYEKNGNLKPWQVSKGSEKKVWWKCKLFGHSWSATVYNRVHGSLCPVCRRELHVSFPEAAIYFYFHQIYPNAKWRMPFVGRYELDIYLPEKKIAIEYDGNEHHQSTVASEREKIKNKLCLEHGITLYRIRQNVPALYDSSIDIILEDEKRDTFAEALKNLIYTISGKHIQIDFAADESDIYGLFYQRVKDNSLQKINPELAKEWHPTKNGDLSPDMVTNQSGKNVWWMLSYDDTKTGKHFNFEWKAKICNRARGAACPYLTNKKVWTGFNDLQTIDPELAKEWHPVKNGGLKPTDILPGSNKKVWWLLPYDDPETGKHFDFEWQASVNDRHRGAGCPFISKSGQAVWTGYNDFATKHPELAKEWICSENGLTPQNVTAGANEKVLWEKIYCDEKTGRKYHFRWKSTVYNRIKNGCPFLSGKEVYVGYNDLATVNPEIAAEWNYKRNGELTPQMVTSKSEKKVWWIYPYDDPNTGKHFDFEWQATIKNRTLNHSKCPYFNGTKVWTGYNDLATTHPELLKEWDYEKNKSIGLTPDLITAGSHSKAWWTVNIKNIETGQIETFSWMAIIKNRANGSGCPACRNSKIKIVYL